MYMYIYVQIYLHESERPDTRKREAKISKCKRASIFMHVTTYHAFIHTHTYHTFIHTHTHRTFIHTHTHRTFIHTHTHRTFIHTHRYRSPCTYRWPCASRTRQHNETATQQFPYVQTVEGVPPHPFPPSIPPPHPLPIAGGEGYHLGFLYPSPPLLSVTRVCKWQLDKE